MATPTWNQIAAPNFSAGNYLIAQAMEQLDKATTGFKSIADQYKDTVQKRNLGLIQEYVNSAKTPEELQSEAFQTGLANLTKPMGGEYDTLAKAQLIDKAYDSLLSRKANQVSISRNEFGLTQDQLEANQKQAISNIFAITDPAMRQAAIDQAVKDKQFNSSLYLQTLAAELTGKTNQQTYDYNKATEDMRKEALRLGNVSTEHAMQIAAHNATTAEMNAETERLKVTAPKNGGGFTVAQGEEALDGIFKGIRDNQSKVLLDIKTKYPYKDMTEVDKEISKTQWASFWRPATAVKAKDIINNSPTLSKLPPSVQAAIYKGIVDRVSENNIAGKFDWVSQDDETYKKYALDSAKSVLGYLHIANSLEKSMIQDGANKLMRMSNGGGGKPVTFEEARDYLNKQLGNSPLSEYQIDSLTLEALNAEEKQKDDKVVKTGDSYLPKGGFGLQLGGNMVVTPNPVAAQAQPKSINKAATVEATSPQNKSGTPLQQAAITPNVNKPISTPLGIVTNPSTIKTKPVADPLRQAALEQTPVPTNNTAQPRQLTTALAAQEQRMQNRARLSLEAQEALQNGQPFVVPAITAKLEETKPRKLTPTEVAQGERMQQAALSRLIAAKLEEKQALARKAFPYASLTPINKATEPLSNTPIPLIQSLLELPVIKNTAKVTTIAELDALVNKARSSTPNFDGIAFVRSLDIDPLLKEAYLNRE